MKDPKAFLFSLTNLYKYNQISVNDDAIYHHNDGIFWGKNNNEIYLHLPAKASQDCRCEHLGETFQVPNGQTAKSQQAFEYFAGASKYQVVELEIYKVIRK